MLTCFRQCSGDPPEFTKVVFLIMFGGVSLLYAFPHEPRRCHTCSLSVWLNCSSGDRRHHDQETQNEKLLVARDITTGMVKWRASSLGTCDRRHLSIHVVQVVHLVILVLAIQLRFDQHKQTVLIDPHGISRGTQMV